MSFVSVKRGRSERQEGPHGIIARFLRRLTLKSMLVTSAVFISVLAAALSAVPIGINAARMVEEVRAELFRERAGITLSALSSVAGAHIPPRNLSGLEDLLDELVSCGVEFATAAWLAESDSDSGILRVLASNDPEILSKIDTAALVPGVSVIRKEFYDAPRLDEMFRALNCAAASELEEPLQKISALEDGRNAAESSGGGMDFRISELSAQIDASLARLSKEWSGFVPDSAGGLLFFRPILFYSGNPSDFVRGIVFLKVGADSMAFGVRSEAAGIIAAAFATTLLSAVIGAVGAAAVAGIVANPIRRMDLFVRCLAAERRRERLSGGGRNLFVQANVEVSRLCDSLNALKDALASSAACNLLQNDGKVVQKAFLPLELSDGGAAQKTTARLFGRGFDCFGYYEGAAAVSGDYFDFRNLDGRWYALIKSDASGHGTPAGLMMTVIATLFNRFFASWSYERCGTNIDLLVIEINDFLESLGMDGKFAAIVICLYDSDSGGLFVCNAGDNLLHIFEAAAGRMRTVNLSPAPAAGSFHSKSIGEKCFHVDEVALKCGDILFLYTDGIEESARLVRGSKRCGGPGNERKERFGRGRIYGVIEAALTRRKFVLTKDTGEGHGEELLLDFESCRGTGEEAVIALSSVEKLFRMYRPCGASEADVVAVDRNIDRFLAEHFGLYESYFCRSEPQASGDSEGNYVVRGGVREDEQADDLAVLALHRL